MNQAEYQRVSMKLLRGLIVEANAQDFEDLFCDIMTLAFPAEFQKIKPQGKKGDRKNDGYRKGLGIFYQVYSPEKPKENIQNAIKKSIKDFKGLHAFWNSIETIKEFNFVFNDKFGGSYPDLYDALKKLETDFPEIKFKLFRADDLQGVFRDLPPQKQMEIIGFDSDETILSYESIGKVAEHLKKIKVTKERDTGLVAPDFEEKITFNNLSKATAALLKKHYENISDVESYFAETEDKNLRQELQEKYTHLYDYAVEKRGEPNNEEVADDIFMDVLVGSSSHSICDSDLRKASLSLMALYFGTCDIYNEPSK